MRLLLTFALLPLPALAETVVAPSGMDLTLQETRVERHEGLGPTSGSETWVRFRFLAPQIAETGYAGVESDFLPLCEHFALPRLAALGTSADVVILSIEDRPVEFGVMDPEAVQVFESFRAGAGRCEWELF